MTQVTLSLPSDGDTIDVADVNTPFNLIANVINGNLDSTNITAGSLTPANLTSGTGTSWAWQTWAPTYTNFSLGDGTLNYAKYIQIGKTIFCRIKVTLGSTSSVSGDLKFSLPVNANSGYTDTSEAFAGAATLNDFGINAYSAAVAWGSVSTARLMAQGSAGAYLIRSTTSSTVPFTWGSTDYWQAEFSYEAA